MDKPSISPQTVAAFARLASGLAVIAAACLGVDVDAGVVENAIIVLIALGMLAYLWWWKNAPVTEAAREAQEYFIEVKREQAEKKERDKQLAALAAEKEALDHEDQRD
ncbi:hypothetical protein E5332_05575 [Enterorhabdus sp. NM05_H27]|nr:hypothetical protein E5332_05575 [Enterorhabdus sp. NM05_H27]